MKLGKYLKYSSFFLMIYLLTATGNAFAADPYSLTLQPLPTLNTQRTSAPVTFTLNNNSQFATTMYVVWQTNNLGWNITPAATNCQILDNDNSATESKVSLAAGASCNLVGTFTPTQVGTQIFGAQVYLHNDKSLALKPQQFAVPVLPPYVSLLSLTWVQPLPAETGVGKPYQVIAKLTNLSSRTINNFNNTFVGTPNEDFSANRSGTCEGLQTLAVGQSCTYVVNYQTQADGAKNLTITASTSDAASTVSVTTSTTALYQAFLDTEWATPFNASVTLDKPAQIIVTVKNSSEFTASLIAPVWSTTISTDDITPTMNGTCGAVLAAGASCTYSANFTPHSNGNKSVMMILNYNAGRSTTSLVTTTTAIPLMVAVGQAGTILTSTDGASWQFQGGGSLRAISANLPATYNQVPTQYAAVGINGTIVTSDKNQTVWTVAKLDLRAYHAKLQSPPDFYAITAGNPKFAKFVAVGEAGTIATTTNGTDWTLVANVPTTNNLQGVAYGNGHYVVVGEHGTILISDDAINWTIVPHSDLSFYAIAYDGDTRKFAAVGDQGKASSASDTLLTQWTDVQTPATSTLRAITVAYGPNLHFVAVGDNHEIIFMGAGCIWMKNSGQDPDFFSHLGNLYGVTMWGSAGTGSSYNNIFVVGEHGVVLRGMTSMGSTDIQWEQLNSVATGYNLYTVLLQPLTLGHIPYPERYVPNSLALVALGEHGEIAYTHFDRGQTPQITNIIASPTTADLTGVVFADQKDQQQFVAVGAQGTSIASSDGKQWHALNTQAQSYDFYSVTFANNQFIASTSEHLANSTDGITWNLQDLPAGANKIESLAYANNRYAAVGDRTIMTCNVDKNISCANAADWQLVNVSVPYYLKSVVATNQARLNFITVGKYGSLYTSDENASWNPQNLITKDFSAVAYANGTAVAVGDGTIQYSNNPQHVGSWGAGADSKEEITTSILNTVTFYNLGFIALGDDGVVATSTNAKDWSIEHYALGMKINSLVH